MILSGNPNRSISRRLQASVLLCAMVILPLGVAHGADYEAVEKGLGEAVSEGELSLEQATIMMNALNGATEDDHGDSIDMKRRFGGWIRSVGERLKAAVKAGKLGEDDAWKKWHHFKANELAPKLKATVNSGTMSQRTAREIWHEIEEAEIGERLKAAVTNGEMTEKEYWARWEHTDHDKDGRSENRHSSREDQLDANEWFEEQGWKDKWSLHYAAMTGDVQAIQKLCKSGIDPDLKMTDWHDSVPLGWAASFVRLNAVKALISLGADPLRPPNKAGFTPLTDARREGHQAVVDYLEAYEIRKLGSLRAENQKRTGPDSRVQEMAGHYERMGISVETLGRIKKALAEDGVKSKQMEGALGGMLRVVHEMKSEGDDFELNPRLRQYFAERVDLTDKQIELVEGLARRLLHSLNEKHLQW